jgi:RHH-type proline utilization regulon transcriptional repressor/proline dehydrogenase/delta 1-pyrroline-5-carboxylate dehydrogenase
MQETQSTILSNAIYAKGEEILNRMEGQSKGSIFSKDYWYGRIMEWSMKNEEFKTRMFRFVDVLPSLQNNNDVASHLKEYFTENGGELPSVFNVGLGFGSLAPGLMAGAIRKNVTQMAKLFIVGENPAEALPVLLKSRKQKLSFTVDILGEATLGESEAKDYQSKYLELLVHLSKESLSWDSIPLIDTDSDGDLPKVNISVKMTSLYSQIHCEAWEESKKIVKDRIRPIFKMAKEKNVFVNLDMEQYSVKHMTLEVFKELLMEDEFQNYKNLGCVIQAYLRDSYSDLLDLVEFAKQRRAPFTIRLVKGAYWDSEKIEAEQRGWPIPVFTVKAESDANYEACSRLLLDHFQHLRVAFGSHNVRSIAAAIAYAEKQNVPKNGFEIQMLFGMADPIKKSLVDMGYRVREYAPVGELMPGMAYLVRRLLENTSNESWLKSKFSDEQSFKNLLKDPTLGLTPSSPLASINEASKNFTNKSFSNEPLLDFAILENRQKLKMAIDQLRKKFPIQVPLQIEGREIKTTSLLKSINPSHSAEVVAEISMASIADAETAIQAASKAFKIWSSISNDQRVQKINQLADLMVRDRFQMIAEQVLEVGKPWAEADADIAEAIDFCRYYAKHWSEMSKPQRVGHAPGETSFYHYQARGVCLVIAPWNFPLAIITGMAAAALVTGNTVILKPAEQSSLVASTLMKLINELNLPKGTVGFVSGYGEEVGDYLAAHKLTSTIAFTGSKAVGLHLLKRAAEVKPDQRHVKRCIIEMGGKNALIIDSDADLDEAVDGVLYSAFGFAGQKCSACSRVIVLDEIYDKFRTRLLDACQSLHVAHAENPEAYLGPVIDQESYERILRIIETGKKESKILFQQTNVPSGGFFVGPTLFDEVDPQSSLAQDEIFGPVVALIRAKDFSHAIQIANDTEYGLTGGIFSRSPANISRASVELEVGNVYINRGITGAMVDRHPFGGFKMSGVGSKTGGPDYLKQFVEPRVITENTMRRGFAPNEG